MVQLFVGGTPVPPPLSSPESESTGTGLHTVWFGGNCGKIRLAVSMGFTSDWGGGQSSWPYKLQAFEFHVSLVLREGANCHLARSLEELKVWSSLRAVCLSIFLTSGTRNLFGTHIGFFITILIPSIARIWNSDPLAENKLIVFFPFLRSKQTTGCCNFHE